MPEIVPLKPIDLRKAWPNEAHDFTPWLAKNLSLLSSSLSLDLELGGVEVHLQGAGRVDILAKQVGTEAKVVIENQLEVSDDSHCLRLLGYAANADANILIWVAKEFTDYHRSVLTWLNETDSIAVYAVAIKAYKVSDVLTCSFDLVIEPQSQPQTGSAANRSNSNTRYAELYRPIRTQLSQAGLNPVGRGGWRGRYRSFETGYPGIIYFTSLDPEHVSVGVWFASQQTHQPMSHYKADIDTGLDAATSWHKKSETGGGYWFELRIPGSSDDSVTEIESGQWVVENLIRLREVVGPYLDRAVTETGS